MRSKRARDVVRMAAGLTVLIGAVSRLDAQSAEQRRVMSSVIALPPSDPFAHYTTPGECVQAAERLHRLYWRSRRADTVVYAPATDSVPASVAASARACGARFSLQTVPMSELRNFATLALWSGQDSLARQAIGRLITKGAPATVDRGWELYLWVQTLLAARPSRVAWAVATLGQMDALGPSAALDRLLAHTRASEYALTVNDRATASAEGHAAIVATQQMSVNDRIDWVWNVRQAYLDQALPVALVHGPAAALAVLDTMTTALTPLRPVGTPDQQQLLESCAQERIRYHSLGQTHLPHVQAQAWYGAAGDTIRPRPGKLTILMFSYGVDYPVVATIRRLQVRYGAQGLDFVFMTTTGGYFREQPMPNPAVESDSVGGYLTRYIKLPGTVAVEVTQFSRLSDGRRHNEETPNLKAFSRMGGVILIDRTGTVRWVDDLRPSNEAVWNAVIHDAL